MYLFFYFKTVTIVHYTRHTAQKPAWVAVAIDDLFAALLFAPAVLAMVVVAVDKTSVDCSSEPVGANCSSLALDDDDVSVAAEVACLAAAQTRDEQAPVAAAMLLLIAAVVRAAGHHFQRAWQLSFSIFQYSRRLILDI